MLQKLINKKITLIFLLFSFILIRCANQLPPPGGEPDKIPPTIVEVYPPDGTIKFDENYFELEFSEYVDKRSVTESIFISPFIEGVLEYNWTGTNLEVTFPEKLKDSVTYTITIGTDVVDLNNKNRMAQSFTFTFSTGDKIDRKIISGKVYGKEQEGIFIYAYKIDEGADSLLNRKPDYVSQTGVDGNFSMQGLGSGNYRVFAVNDQFRDYLYQQDQDEIGVPHQDIHLTDADSIYTNLYFLLFNADTTKPRLISSIMTDRNHLLVSSSKVLNEHSIRAENYYLFDSTDNKKYEIVYAFKGKTKPEEFILMLDEQINSDNQVYLFADTLTDLLNNVTINDFTKVVVSDREDTSSIKIVATEPTEGGLTDIENIEIKIYFDEAFNKDFNNSAIAFTDTFNKPISFDIDFFDDATLLIKPAEKLKTDKNYIIKLQLGSFVDMAGNSTDSLFTLKFKTISGLEFTGISGNVIDLSFAKNPYLVLENTEEPKFKYEQKLTSDKFEFNRVEPGKYLLWSYLDENGDGKFNYGWPEPIQYSESFAFYPDTLNLRPRWEVSDLIFKFK
ncbi:MAG: Ig-like domain-containing protein [Ignavibacteriaceae bacterium]|nr:Ig-like domain-containing protein [Ignavibacteriaceae bacterium]